MFANVGWGEMLVLVVVGLVVLGPERLPGAIRWTATALRQAIGPDFDDLRQPLSELQKLRGLTPRAALTKHLFDGDDSLFTGNFDKVEKVVPQAMPPSSPVSEPPVAGPAPFDPDAT